MEKVKLSILIFSLLLFSNVNAQDAKKIFLENLTVFENMAEDKDAVIDLNTLYEAREFLIKTTGITYEMEKSFNMPIFPPKNTIKNWRDWFEKNKDRLYWDEKLQEVRVKT